VCVYSTNPPKESVFTVTSLEVPKQVIRPEEGWFEAFQKSCVPLLATQTNRYISNTNHLSKIHILARHLQFGREDWDKEFASQVHGVFAASGKDVEATCQSYFENFHPWLSFISEPDFWRSFSSADSRPEFSILLLGMYLITHIPALGSGQVDTLDPVYFISKCAWSRLQKVQEASIVLIQAGLLIATYESGQALAEKSRSTMVACAEMGYEMQLHKSLRRKIEGDLSSQNELILQKRVWWGIVALER
jgi:hypothetical protein